MTGDASSPRCLNLVWRRRVLDTFLEAPFIRAVLLVGLNRPVRWIAIEDDADLPIIDDVLVCSFGDSGGYLRQLRAAGKVNIGVFHLGDERGADPTGFYADADYVLRHYHVPDRLSPSVLWVPNGWARGVGPADPTRLVPFAQRRHEVFFAGYVSGDGRHIDERIAMLDSLRDNRIPATVVLSEGFGQGLGSASYAAYMGDAKLALVPGGNAPETIRFYDALECGALPMLLDQPWLHAADGAGALGPVPVLTLASWADLPGALAADPMDLAERAACGDWWAQFKAHMAARVAAALKDAFADT